MRSGFSIFRHGYRRSKEWSVADMMEAGPGSAGALEAMGSRYGMLPRA